MLAARTGIAPDVLWATDPTDLATLVDVLTDKPKRRGGRRG